MPAEHTNDIEAEIAQLRALDFEQLRLRWRTTFGRTPPPLPKHFLMRLLAYRLQAQIYGDLSRTTIKLLDDLARNKKKPSDAQSRSIGMPGVRQLRLGTKLVREHAGERHEVLVVDGGFAWNGTIYPSLTKIAHAITGTNWNGPRFFGLREGKRKVTP